jgi:hypothetical protein
VYGAAPPASPKDGGGAKAAVLRCLRFRRKNIIKAPIMSTTAPTATTAIPALAPVERPDDDLVTGCPVDVGEVTVGEEPVGEEPVEEEPVDVDREEVEVTVFELLVLELWLELEVDVDFELVDLAASSENVTGLSFGSFKNSQTTVFPNDVSVRAML